jgi:CRISPR/Cas system-associated exonuclease Cas4 (RecB family)
MLTLNSGSIRDFQTCARLYDFRHNENLYEPIEKRAELAARFESTLKKVVAFFFYKKQGGQVPSYSALLNRWERLWFPKDVTIYDLSTEQQDVVHGNLASYTAQAATALLNFYEAFAEDEGEPFLIDEEFTFTLETVRVSGQFDLILRYRKTNKLKVIKWWGGSKRPHMGSLMVEMSIMRQALESRLEDRKVNATFGYYDLTSTKPTYHIVEVKKEDLKALSYWVREIRDEEVYPSRRGLTYYCKSCPFNEECLQWKGWPSE